MKWFWKGLLFVVFLSPTMWAAEGIFDVEEMRIRYEENLERQLDKTLLNVLPPNTFDVMVNVKLAIATKEVKTEKIIQKKTSEKGGPKTTKAIPGFDPTLVEDGQSDEDTDLKESFGFDKEIAVKKVLVVLILHKFLSDDKKALGKDIITDKVRSIYGKMASLVVRESDFVSFHTPTISSRIQEFFYFHSTTLLYFLMGVLLLILLFWLIRMIIPKKKEYDFKKTLDMLQKGKDGTKQVDPDVLFKAEIDRCLMSLVQAIGEDPNLLKDFIRDLPPTEANVFFYVVAHSSLKGPITEILGEIPAGKEKTLELETIASTFHDMESRLKHYIQLRKVAEKIPFGYLKSMDMTSLVKKIGATSLEKIAVILRYLPSQRTGEFLACLPPDVKAELLERVQSDAFLQSLHQIEAGLDQELKTYFMENGLKKEGKGEGQLFTQMLDQDPQLSETMEVVKKRGALKDDRRLKKYFSTFDDFLAANTADITRCLQELDNQSLAMVLKSLPKDRQEKMFALLPNLRKNVVREQMIALGSGELNLAPAMNELMKIYRNQLKV